jgi:hypothetical protein
MKRPVSKGPRTWLFALALVPMLAVFPYLRGLNNPNEFVRVFTVMAIVERGTFAIDEPVALWGWVNDMARVPSREDGRPHYFMVKGPAIVYAGVPGYFLFSKVVAPLAGHRYPTAQSSADERLWWLRMSTWALRLTTIQLPCFFFLLWLEKYLRDFVGDPALRLTAVVAGGLGTNFLAYTHMFASHAPYACLAFVGFSLIERELRGFRDPSSRRGGRALLAGLCIGGCVALEYQSLFVAIVLSLFACAVFHRPRTLISYIVGGSLAIPPVMYFQWRAYGNPFTPGHKLLETQQFALEHKMGLWGILWPSWSHIQALAVDPGFGFFGMSPFMWIGLLGIPLLVMAPPGDAPIKRSLRRVTLVWALACAVLIGVNAGFVEWRAGWTVGPRYLVVFAPFFAFGSACALERIARESAGMRAIVRGASGGLALASVLAIGTVGLLVDTLPTTIERPLAQFAIPMLRAGFVPHHVGEWLGWRSTALVYLACACILSAPLVSGLFIAKEKLGLWTLRGFAFAFALVLGLLPAFSKPSDGSELGVLHRDTRGFLAIWEPEGQDRITRLREHAERTEREGRSEPCEWLRLADLERSVGNNAQALRAEVRAGSVTRAQCPRSWF